MLVTLFVILVGYVYETFSRGVFSFLMIYAFAVPLVLGTLLNMILERLKAYVPGFITGQLWHCGVATVTVGMILGGVFQIYGSADERLNLFFIVGALMLASAVVLYFTRDRAKKTD